MLNVKGMFSYCAICGMDYYVKVESSLKKKLMTEMLTMLSEKSRKQN